MLSAYQQLKSLCLDLKKREREKDLDRQQRQHGQKRRRHSSGSTASASSSGRGTQSRYNTSHVKFGIIHAKICNSDRTETMSKMGN